VLYTTSAFLLSWEWPRPQDMRATQPADVALWNRELIYGISPTYAHWMEFFTISLLALAALGALPWPRRWRGQTVPTPDAAARPWWRSLLWLAWWIVVPVYVFYCVSVPGFESPMMWLRQHSIWIAAGVALILWLAIPVNDSLRDRAQSALQMILVAAAILAVCQAIFMQFPDQPNGSMWMPRYLAIVWPAFAIALCVLLMRLPGRPLRWFAIALLLGINLYKTITRLTEDTEPPLQQMAADVVNSDAARRELIGDRLVTWRPFFADQPITRTFIEQFRTDIPHPGHSDIYTMAGRYYLVMAENWALTPFDFRSMAVNRFDDYFYDIPPANDVQSVADDANSDRRLGRIIVWTRIGPGRNEDNSLSNLLGPKWRLVSDVEYFTRMHWLWQQLATYRRREFLRVN